MKLALVLGGGGARGAAHIGVLQALEEAKIKPRLITGTSAGALVAGFYAAGFTPDEIRIIALNIDWKMFHVNTLSLIHDAIQVLRSCKSAQIPQLKTRGLIRTQKFERYLAQYLHNTTLDELILPFAAPAVNIQNGKTIVFCNSILKPNHYTIISDALVRSVLRASMSIPGVFPPTRMQGLDLVDGGVSNNLPIDLAVLLGAEQILAVDVGEALRPIKPLNFINVSLRALDIMGMELTSLRNPKPALTIHPQLSHIDTLDFNKIPECIEAGYVATWQALDSYKSVI